MYPKMTCIICGNEYFFDPRDPRCGICKVDQRANFREFQQNGWPDSSDPVNELNYREGLILKQGYYYQCPKHMIIPNVSSGNCSVVIWYYFRCKNMKCALYGKTVSKVQSPYHKCTLCQQQGELIPQNCQTPLVRREGRFTPNP